MEDRINLERRGKACEDITELNLDNCRAIHQICGLTDDYLNLRVLSLINVGLTSLKGLPKLPALKKLELSDNRISAGLEQLENTPNLTHLSLSGNKIKDIESLKPLIYLTNLKSLDLFNCSVTTLADYRNKVFQLIPQLKFLDGLDSKENEYEENDSSDEEEVEDEENEDLDGMIDDEEAGILDEEDILDCAEDDEEEDPVEDGDEEEEDDDDGPEDEDDEDGLDAVLDGDAQLGQGDLGDDDGFDEEGESVEDDEDDEDDGPGLEYLIQKNPDDLYNEDDDDDFAPGEEDEDDDLDDLDESEDSSSPSKLVSTMGEASGSHISLTNPGVKRKRNPQDDEEDDL